MFKFKMPKDWIGYLIGFFMFVLPLGFFSGLVIYLLIMDTFNMVISLIVSVLYIGMLYWKSDKVMDAIYFVINLGH